MAGFLEAPLLQEPIAAAIAYGASAAGKSQRWLVFDLGGGTLDIAVVSTRNGRLAVLEHQGNNRLGGKDIDRAIAEKLIWPRLAEGFALPGAAEHPAEHGRLLRQVVRLAEGAKIALSTAESAVVDVFNVGDDLKGAAIEGTLTLTRAEMEKEIEPLLASCLELVGRALAGARLGAGDVDRVLLVGGPTQMPAVRGALVSVLGEKLDYSIDPMTVVAQGAALYASTVERATAAPDAAGAGAGGAAAAPRGAVTIQLNHERASGTLQSPVAGIVQGSGAVLSEVKIDAEGGVWSSGWLAVKGGRFVTEVMLTPGKAVTRFLVSGRTATGAAVAVVPGEFAVAYMLPMAAPPLPHTVAIELAPGTGKAGFDPVFKRHTPLPAEARRTYRADRTLRPSEVDATLPIKFWEIEVSADPEERWWAGCVHIRADKLKRPLMEGADIELTVKIDKSRKMTVDVFVPMLNQGFSDDVYVPDPPTTRGQLQDQLDLCFERISQVFRAVYAADREDLRERAAVIQTRLEVIAEQVEEEQSRRTAGGGDPDALLAPTDQLRQLRMAITSLEEQLDADLRRSPYITKLRADHRWTGTLVERHGTASQKEQFERLSGQFTRYLEANDPRGLKFVEEQLRMLRVELVWEQPVYWENQLSWLQSPGRRFVNAEEAGAWMRKAEGARERQDLPALREAVNRLWMLQPPDTVEAAKEQAMQSGLKGM
jgi:molecular chaperone DnaK